MAPFIIFGCGGHSRSVTDILLSYRKDLSPVFIDEGAQVGEKLYGFPILSKIEGELGEFFFGIGNNEKRKAKYEEMGTSRLISIVSPYSYRGRESTLGKGVFIGNFSHIGPEAYIGDNTIVNNGATIEHEVVVGSHCHIGPRAVISGRCKIGDLVFVGVGAVIKDSISICSHVGIGAGAVIVKDITEPGVYIGCPGKKYEKESIKNLSLLSLPCGVENKGYL